MRGQTVILATIAVLVLLGSVALRQAQAGLLPQTQEAALAQSSEPPWFSWYTVERGTASGGSYRLTGLAWEVGGVASGGGYHLLGPASPGGGNQCCCTYLPCVVRNFR